MSEERKLPITSYGDYFVRIDSKLTEQERRSYVDIIPVREYGDHNLKLNQLYKDCFGSHVTSYLEGPLELTRSASPERFITVDSIDSQFLCSHYQPPFVYLGDNSVESDVGQRNSVGVTLQGFLERVSANPIQSCSSETLQLGTNRINYLVGEVGVGKSTYLCRLVIEAMKLPVDPDGYTLVPVVYDFETRYREGEQLKQIGRAFWADLYNLTVSTLNRRTEWKKQAQIDKILISPSLGSGEYRPQLELHLLQLIHYLASKKIRLLFIFDNLDRYHFRYTAYSFFKKGELALLESLQQNIATLTTEFDRGDLSTAGLCILFVCRQYVHDYIFNDPGGVSPSSRDRSVYTIAQTPVEHVVSSRFDLFKKATDFILPDVKIVVQNSWELAMTHLKAITDQQATRDDLPNSGPVMRALVDIGHNGHRSLVKFLSSLSFRYVDGQAMSRLLTQQTHLLLLLYICNNHRKYTQDQNHFPNIFLNDCLVRRDDFFPSAHEQHVHSYWLKYLMLKYIFIYERRGRFLLGQNLIEVFAAPGGYEPHFVNYMLGSLCTTNEFSCLKIDASTNPHQARLRLTERGKYLVSHDRRMFHHITGDIDFCFSFHYLQMVVDDPLIALREDVVDSIFNTSSDYSYLYLPDDAYGRVASKTVIGKLRSVLHFLHELESWWMVEQALHPDLFEKLAAVGVILNGEAIRKNLLDTASHLLRPAELDDLHTLNQQLKKDYCTVPDAIKSLPKGVLTVREI